MESCLGGRTAVAEEHFGGIAATRDGGDDPLGVHPADPGICSLVEGIVLDEIDAAVGAQGDVARTIRLRLGGRTAVAAVALRPAAHHRGDDRIEARSSYTAPRAIPEVDRFPHRVVGVVDAQVPASEALA